MTLTPRAVRCAAAMGILLVGLFAGSASARPTYANQIPNGFSVPNPDTGGACLGVGHTSCFGGGSRNPFGLDFDAAGRTWTVELCNMDSDGDGISNGAELGDPCCQWTAENGFGAIQGTEVSHPGFDSSALAEAAPNCDGPASTPAATTPSSTAASPPPELPPPTPPGDDSGSFQSTPLLVAAATIAAVTLANFL